MARSRVFEDCDFEVSNNILQAEAEKLSGFTPSIIQPEAAGRGLYARCNNIQSFLDSTYTQ